MQILLVWLVAAVAAMQTPSVNQGVTRSASVVVRAVIDGETIAQIGVGGMGRCIGRRVPACRVRSPSRRRHNDSASDSPRETRIVSSLNHPNISGGRELGQPH